jgi:MFS family permease
MNRERTGLVVFWVGVVFMVFMAGLGGWGNPPLISRWGQALNIGLAPFFFWAFSVPIGALLMGIGMLLYTGAKASRVWAFGIGVFLAVIFIDFLLRGYLMATDAHYSGLFGFFGAAILVVFIALIWDWAKRRKRLEGKMQSAADLRLVGYVFFIIATWFICGAFGAQFSESLSQFIPRSPVNIILNLFLGWLFLFLAQRKLSQLKE